MPTGLRVMWQLISEKCNLRAQISPGKLFSQHSQLPVVSGSTFFFSSFTCFEFRIFRSSIWILPMLNDESDPCLVSLSSFWRFISMLTYCLIESYRFSRWNFSKNLPNGHPNHAWSSVLPFLCLPDFVVGSPLWNCLWRGTCLSFPFLLRLVVFTLVSRT